MDHHTRNSTIDWDRDIYAKGKMLNRWPYSELVSAVVRETAGKNRSLIRVLELGCGAGNNLWFLADEGFDCSGIDMSPTVIEFAKKRMNELGLTVELAVGDVVRLPWSDGEFDIVLDRGGLTQNAYPELLRILGEALRVLKPGGVLHAFTLFGLDHPGRRFGREMSENAYDHFTEGLFKNAGLTSFFTADSLRRLFADFSDIDIYQKPVFAAGRALISDEYSVRAIK